MSLFDRFYKKEQSRTSVAEGSGLGLAIAKSIIELHDGKIDAKYTEGMLQFNIELPVTA
jgi:hypothetical protein